MLIPRAKCASMAQLVEQRIRNAQVVGSSPTTSLFEPFRNYFGTVLVLDDNTQYNRRGDVPASKAAFHLTYSSVFTSYFTHKLTTGVCLLKPELLK